MTYERQESRLKVVTFSPYPLTPQTPDGVSQFVLGIQPYLERLGCEVVLIGPKVNPPLKNDADYSFGRTPFRFGHHGTNHPIPISLRQAPAKRMLETILTNPDANNPDFVFDFHEPLLLGHYAHPIISATPKRKDGKTIPTTIAHHHAQIEGSSLTLRMALLFFKYGVWRFKFENGRPGKTQGYANTIMDVFDGRIAVSQATATTWSLAFPGNYEVIPNGFDTTKLTPDGPIIEEWKQDKKYTLLFAGRHDERKGIIYLIQALSHLKQQGKNNIKLKIAGDGAETEKLQRLTKNLGITEDVEFLGVLPRTELEKAYRTADIVVCPSTGGEGFGRVIAEALSSETLVVASDINGYREATGGNQPFARLAKPADPVDLARVIMDLLNLPEEEKARLQKEARTHVLNNFDWEIVAKKTFDYYLDRLQNHGIVNQEENRIPSTTERVIFQNVVRSATTVFDRLIHRK